MWWNEFVDHRSVLLSLWSMEALPQDCRDHVLSWLPLCVWCQCEMCGIPLAYASKHGGLWVSREAKYAYDICQMCYLLQQE